MNNDGNYTPDNCKFSTRSQNSQNTKLIHKNNTSGYRCVFWHITDKKWKVIINHQGKRYNIGSFKNSYDAALAYNEFVIKNKTLHPLNIL